MKSFFIILTAFTVLAVAAPDAKLAEVSNLNEAARGIARAAAPEAVSNKVAMAEESEAFGGCGQCANGEMACWVSYLGYYYYFLELC